MGALRDWEEVIGPERPTPALPLAPSRGFGVGNKSILYPMSAGDQKITSNMAREGISTSLTEPGTLHFTNRIPSYKSGGLVRKTGIALVHKGERIISKKKTKKKR